jgi:hypothetical protein
VVSSDLSARRRARRPSRKSERRITTRRPSAAGSRGGAVTRAARTRVARAAPRAETLQVTFELRDVSNRLIEDPETFFTFRRVSDRRQIGDQIAMPLTGRPVTFDLPVVTGEIVVCELDAQRFRFAHSPVFFRSPGPPITKVSQLLREPKQWTPSFTRWRTLNAGFADLKRVLRVSQKVTLFRKTTPIADLLVNDAYDGMSGADVLLAKTALLNTFYRLNATKEPVSAQRSWFSFVTRVLAIGRERVLAFVEPQMEVLVRQIHANIDEFRGDYERTPAGNHRGNVPPELQNRIASMISIKSTHDTANFQLTLTHLTGPDEVLLDADIDENGQALRHFLDLFKHKVTGGTHPHDIHELLVLLDGQIPGFDLGYRLV